MPEVENATITFGGGGPGRCSHCGAASQARTTLRWTFRKRKHTVQLCADCGEEFQRDIDGTNPPIQAQLARPESSAVSQRHLVGPKLAPLTAGRRHWDQFRGKELDHTPARRRLV